MKIFLSVLMTFLFCFMLFGIYETTREKNIEVMVRHIYVDNLSRNQINETLKDNKRFNFIYHEIAKNQEIAETILRKSLEQNIPVNLAFALASIESRFDPNAVNKNHKSTDYGLFQLNNRSFPKVDYFNIEENTKYALAFLKEHYKRNDSWEIAVVLYNAGSFRNTGQMSLKHLHRILEEERRFDKIFNEIYKNMEKFY